MINCGVLSQSDWLEEKEAAKNLWKTQRHKVLSSIYTLHKLMWRLSMDLG